MCNKMAYSTRCLKFVVLVFNVIFAVSGVAVTVVSVANVVHFYFFNHFVPSSVYRPLLLLASTGPAACLVAGLGWRYAMAGKISRLYVMALLLTAVILSEFGGAVWALTTRADFEDDVAHAMTQSLSSYTKDKTVTEEWKSLQKELRCCGIDGPHDFRRFGMVDWSCCLSETHHQGPCHTVIQRGCLISLTQDIRDRLLRVSLLSIAVAIGQIPGVFFTCCFANSLKNEKRRNKLRKETLPQRNS